jgi:hypothetical protein
MLGSSADKFSADYIQMEERRLAEHNLIQGPLKRNTGDALGDIAGKFSPDVLEGPSRSLPLY